MMEDFDPYDKINRPSRKGGFVDFDPYSGSMGEADGALEKGSLGNQVQDIASAGTGVLDLMGMLPGMVGGFLGGVGRIGPNDPKINPYAGQPPAKTILEEMERGARLTTPSEYVDEWKGQRDRPGYRAVMKPIELLTQGIHKGGEAVKGLAERGLFGSERTQPAKAEELGAGTEVAGMLALPFLKVPRFGPREIPRIPQTAESLKGARESYRPRDFDPWSKEEFERLGAEEFIPEYRPRQFEGAEESLMSEPKAVRTRAETEFQESGGLAPETLVHKQALELGREQRGLVPLENLTGRGHRDELLPQSPGPIDFARYDPARIAGQVEATDKPGFLRSAEEVIRARELETLERPPVLPAEQRAQQERRTVLDRRETARPEDLERRTESQVKIDAEIAKHLDAYLKGPGPRGRGPAGGAGGDGTLYSFPANVFDALSKEVRQKGPTEVYAESARDSKLDRRPIDEVVQQTFAEGKDIQDFSPETKKVVKRMYGRFTQFVKQNLLQDQTISLLMKNIEGTGPLIKWTVDQMSIIDRNHTTKVRQARDSALMPFRRMYWNRKTRPDLLEAWRIWQENAGKRDLGPEDFKKDKQWRIYESFQGVYSQVLQELNAKRTQAGLKPIDRIPSYFNSFWEGDYRFFAKDSLGNTKFAFGTKTEIGGELLRKKLMAKHPDLTWDKVHHIKKSRYDLSDLSAFDEMLRIMSSDDPVTLAVQKTYREILQHRGFGKTGIHKKFIPGFLGSEGGILGLRNFERAFEQYIQQAYRYMGNLEKQRVLDDLVSIPVEHRNKIPDTMDFIVSYVHKARGAKLGGKQILDVLLESLFKTVGLGESFALRGVREISRVASIYWLLTPKFLTAQPFQTGNAFAKLVQEEGLVAGAKFFTDGWMNVVKPDATAKEVASWASKRGYLDPTIKNLLESDLGQKEFPTSGWYELSKEVAMLPAATFEHHLVRLPMMLMFEKALREKIPDKEARFSEAAEKANYYAVDYGRTHVPMIYDKAGLVGEMARPLKAYSHNFFGQFMEHVQYAKNKGDYTPLAVFFGFQALTAGLKGTLFVAEATAIITAINFLFDTEIPTPEKVILQSDLPDLLVFGGLSALTGRDVSSAVAAPGLPSMFSFPPISFTADAVEKGWDYIKNKFLGLDTDYHRLRAAMAITPAVMHEFLKNLWTPEGQPVVNPNDPQLRGQYRRDEGIFGISTLTGTKSTKEARVEMMMRNVRRELARDAMHKMDALDAIVDRMRSRKPVEPFLFQQYLRQGGDPKRLAQSIQERFRQRLLTGEERGMDFKALTTQQMHKLEVMRQYLDRATPKEPQEFDPEDETGGFRPIQFKGSKKKNYVYSDTPGEGRITNKFEETQELMGGQLLLDILQPPPQGKVETEAELKESMKKKYERRNRKIKM